MLEIAGLSTSYGPVQALRDVSLSVPDGSITAVLGANGAGKTTLLRSITGMVRPRQGRVTFEDHDLTRMAVEDIVRLGVGHVPEGRGVIQELTVEENLRLGALWRPDRDDRRRALQEMYDLFPSLASRKRRAGSTLSGGERQMLVLGRALMGRPQVLLLDEPSLGLAPMVTAQIMALLRDMSSQRGLTILLVEQNARSALSIADQGVVLSLGQVVATDDAAALAADADLRHHYLGF
jgi:branched-chain amino acid transport system ATP-binding protein